MKTLLAALFAGMFALGTVSAFAADKEMKKDEAKTDCKDAKNKDHKDCTKKK